MMKNIKYLKTINKTPTVKQLDKLWSEAVKLRDRHTCQYTLAIYNTEINSNSAVMNSHHLLKKATNRLRWDLDNGITLTKGVHFSVAHSQKPTQENQFRQWALDRLPKHKRDKLELLERCRSTGGVDKFGVKLYLLQKIKEYGEQNGKSWV